MARVEYTTKLGNLKFTFDAQGEKNIFKRLASIQETFEEEACGCCASKNIRFKVRPATTHDNRQVEYYELNCGDCGARLSFGQHQNTITLFAKRRDKDGNAMENNGWYVYAGTGQHDEHDQTQQPYNQTPPRQQNPQQPPAGYGNGGSRPPQRQQPQQPAAPPPQPFDIEPHTRNDEIPF